MAFLITRDFITRKNEEGYGVGVTGPRTARDETIARLQKGEGDAFRLLDDDGLVYYHGRFLDDTLAEDYQSEPEFQALDCYGTPNAGAAWIQYRNEHGTWETL